MFLTHDERQGMAAQCLLIYMRQGIHAKENEHKLVLYDKHHWFTPQGCQRAVTFPNSGFNVVANH